MSGRTFLRALAGVVVAIGLLIGLGVTAQSSAQGRSGLDRAIEVQERHTEALMARKEVVGMAVGLNQDGQHAVKVYVKNTPDRADIPKELDGVPVVVQVTGEIRALVDRKVRFDRPVPIGVSTGHPDITAGTIGARVTDGTKVYALSNNHVYANENKSKIGDNVLQPGPYDGGKDPDDKIGTLSDFEPIVFTAGARNTIDAAIALSSSDLLGNATPSDGYGTPESTIVSAVLGQQVMKDGRTTALTHGQITGINATVRVRYSSGIARFVDQIIVESAGAFIQGGDSGSLLVTDPGKNPVGLLFAGNSDGTLAVANRIDLVLDRFKVTIDGTAATPVTDIAITAVSAPSSVVQGTLVDVGVTVKNVGNQDVTSDISVTLADKTDGVVIGTETISGGLSAGASTSLTFSWNTTDASLGDHTLEAAQGYSDGNTSNDSKTTMVTITKEQAAGTMHVASIDMATGKRSAGPITFVWATATVTIVDGSGVAVNGATANGHWEGATTDSDSGITGADGQVSLQSDSVKNPPSGTTFTFVVDSVAKDGWTYDSSANVETSDSITAP